MESYSSGNRTFDVENFVHVYCVQVDKNVRTFPVCLHLMSRDTTREIERRKGEFFNLKKKSL